MCSRSLGRRPARTRVSRGHLATMLTALLFAGAAIGTCTPNTLAHNPSTVFDARWPDYDSHFQVIPAYFETGFPGGRKRKRVKSASKAFKVSGIPLLNVHK